MAATKMRAPTIAPARAPLLTPVEEVLDWGLAMHSNDAHCVQVLFGRKKEGCILKA